MQQGPQTQSSCSIPLFELLRVSPGFGNRSGGSRRPVQRARPVPLEGDAGHEQQTGGADRDLRGHPVPIHFENEKPDERQKDADAEHFAGPLVRADVVEAAARIE